MDRPTPSIGAHRVMTEIEMMIKETELVDVSASKGIEECVPGCVGRIAVP